MITTDEFDQLDRPPTEQEIKDVYGIVITDHQFSGYPSCGWRGELCRQCGLYEVQHIMLRTLEQIEEDRIRINAEIRAL